MDKILSRIAYIIVPAVFLGGAVYFFKIGAPIAGGICIFVALATARN